MAMPGGRPGRRDDPYAEARLRLQAALARQQAPDRHTPTIDELLVEVMEQAPLPAVAGRIMDLGGDQRFSAHELASVIASDQALTTRLLRLANSAYYGAPRRIGTVRDAVVLLGFRAVQQVALASCMMQARRPAPHLDYEQYWQFSITTALLAEVLARTEGVHAELAFTAGVIHNVGLLALDQHRPEVLREALARAKSDQVTLHQAERAVMGYTDADLGAALVSTGTSPRRWWRRSATTAGCWTTRRRPARWVRTSCAHASSPARTGCRTAWTAARMPPHPRTSGRGRRFRSRWSMPGAWRRSWSARRRSWRPPCGDPCARRARSVTSTG